jgi:hypothetical protein
LLRPARDRSNAAQQADLARALLQRERALGGGSEQHPASSQAPQQPGALPPLNASQKQQQRQQQQQQQQQHHFSGSGGIASQEQAAPQPLVAALPPLAVAPSAVRCHSAFGAQAKRFDPSQVQGLGAGAAASPCPPAAQPATSAWGAGPSTASGDAQGYGPGGPHGSPQQGWAQQQQQQQQQQWQQQQWEQQQQQWQQQQQQQQQHDSLAQHSWQAQAQPHQQPSEQRPPQQARAFTSLGTGEEQRRTKQQQYKVGLGVCGPSSDVACLRSAEFHGR